VALIALVVAVNEDQAAKALLANHVFSSKPTFTPILPVILPGKGTFYTGW
jgi:hypothetical protein